MNVVFLKDVEGVAKGGDVKEVKNGFARNYLLPKQLAVPANHNSLRRTERLKTDAASARLELLGDMRSLAEAISDTQIKVEMRAGSSGKLYGSVTNTTVASRLSELTSRDIDRRVVLIDDPIREVGVFDVRLQLHPEVEVTINMVVYPTGTDPQDTIAAVEAAKVEKTEEVLEPTEEDAPAGTETKPEEASPDDEGESLSELEPATSNNLSSDDDHTESSPAHQPEKE